MEKDDLKIEFRAVPFVFEQRVLEYRISPKQDLTYYVEKSYLWGLIKFKRKCKYDTGWKRISVFQCGLTSHYYDINEWLNYMPIFCDNQETLNWFKRTFETYGAFNRYIVEKEKPEIEEYWKKRNKYLEGKKKILY